MFIRQNNFLPCAVKQLLKHNGQAEQQAEAGNLGRPPCQHRILGRRDSRVVQGIPQGLPQRSAECGGVQEDLRQLLPLRRRLQVRRARLSNVRRQQ